MLSFYFNAQHDSIVVVSSSLPPLLDKEDLKNVMNHNKVFNNGI